MVTVRTELHISNTNNILDKYLMPLYTGSWRSLGTLQLYSYTDCNPGCKFPQKRGSGHQLLKENVLERKKFVLKYNAKLTDDFASLALVMQLSLLVKLHSNLQTPLSFRW